MTKIRSCLCKLLNTKPIRAECSTLHYRFLQSHHFLLWTELAFIDNSWLSLLDSLEGLQIDWDTTTKHLNALGSNVHCILESISMIWFAIRYMMHCFFLPLNHPDVLFFSNSSWSSRIAFPELRMTWMDFQSASWVSSHWEGTGGGTWKSERRQSKQADIVEMVDGVDGGG